MAMGRRSAETKWNAMPQHEQEDDDDFLSVSVRFRASKAAFGSLRYSQAKVKKSFMQNMTALNKLIVYGKSSTTPPSSVMEVEEQEGELIDVSGQKGEDASPSPASAPASTLPPSSSSARLDDYRGGEVNEVLEESPLSFRTLPPALSSLSSYLLESNVDPKGLKRKLHNIDACDMNILCCYDFWLWIEKQKLFAPVSRTTHDAHLFELLDTGLEKMSNCWFEPLEKRHSLQEVEVLTTEIDIIEAPLPAPAGWVKDSMEQDVISKEIEEMSKDLLNNNINTNFLIAAMRKKHLENSSFWKEATEVNKEKESAKNVLRRLGKWSNKRRRTLSNA